MFTKTSALMGLAFACLPFAAFAESQITIHHQYAVSAAGSPSGAAFMVIHNEGDTADRLIDVRSDVAERTELHTHLMENGIAKMRRVEGGFEIPAGSAHELARGGDHVMLMQLMNPLNEGDTFPLTLVFEQAGEMVIDVTVQAQAPAMDHSQHGDMTPMHNHGN